MPSASSPPEVRAEHRDGHLTGRRGRRLYWQAWEPVAARATVVIAHGASEHGGRYRYVVERLIPDGFELYALDHRGHGRSEGPRAQLDRLDDVVADLDAFIDLVRADRPLFLLGHSMGGCVALAYAVRHQDKLTGLALSAPLAHLDAAPAHLRLLCRVLSVVAPNAGVIDVEAQGISRDPDEVRAYEEDPLVYRGKLPARTVQELADTIARFPDRVRGLTLPILVMHGTADRIVPIAGSEMVATHAASDDLTIRRYDGFYHELFNEPAGARDQPLDDLAAWLSARV